MPTPKSKYNNCKVYFDPIKKIAYWGGEFRTREFKLLKDIDSLTRERCYKFDSMHEYYCYRIVELNLPPNLQLLRQVNFLVVPKSPLGATVVYRADLVIAPITESESDVRVAAMKSESIPFDFLIIEPKGVLTPDARIKHMVLCSCNKVTCERILFVASNYAALKLPGEVKSSLFHLASALRERIELIFGETDNGN